MSNKKNIKKIDMFYRGDIWIVLGHNKYKRFKKVEIFQEGVGFSKARVELEIKAETNNYRWIEVKHYGK